MMRRLTQTPYYVIAIEIAATDCNFFIKIRAVPEDGDVHDQI